MGLEAGWNCHICLRSEHSTDAVPGTEPSQGYASLLGSVKIESLPDIRFTSPQSPAEDGQKADSGWSPRRRVRCSSAPDVILFHSANEPQRRSVTSENRHSDDLPALAATWIWEVAEEDNNIDQHASSLIPHSKADVPLRHRQMSERSVSVSLHEPRRRSSSVRSASIQDAQGRLLAVSRAMHADTVEELEDDRKRSLLEEEKRDNDENADKDDDSVASYMFSRPSSYTESLPPGLGNRVCLTMSLLYALLR